MYELAQWTPKKRAGFTGRAQSMYVQVANAESRVEILVVKKSRCAAVQRHAQGVHVRRMRPLNMYSALSVHRRA